MAQDLDLKIKISADGKVAAQEIDRVIASLRKMGATDDQIAGFKKATSALKGTQDAAKSSALSLDDFQSALGAIGAAQAVSELIRLNAQFEAQRNALTAILGSQEAAQSKMTELAGTADRLGQSAAGLTEQYTMLAAATKGTALEGAQTDAVFNAVVGAMGKLGKSSADTARALMAVSQMASKGTVSAEEMRQQLGEALPGAMQALSTASGLSVAELNKLMESGELLAVDTLPLLAQGLNQAFAVDTATRIDTIGASLERLKNTAAQAAISIGQAGVADALSQGMEYATRAVGGAAAAVTIAGQTIGTTLGALDAALRDGTGSWEQWAMAIDQSLLSAAEQLRAGEQQTASVQEQSNALAQLAKASLQSSKSYAEAKTATEQHAKALQAASAAGESAAKAELARAQALGEESGVLRAKAALEEAALATTRAQLTAAQEQAGMTRARIATLQAEIAELERVGAANGMNAEQIRQATDAKQKQIVSLQQGLTVQDAAITKTREQSAAQTEATQAAQLAVQTYGDQSAQLGQLVVAHDQATAAMRSAQTAAQALRDSETALLTEQAGLLELQRQGADVTESLRQVQDALAQNTRALVVAEDSASAATTTLAQAQALLADAAQDALAALSGEQQIIEAESRLLDAQAAVRRTHTERLIEAAKARGDEARATELSSELLRQEYLRLSEQAQLKRDHAELMRQELEAKSALAEADGVLTTAEKQQLEQMRIAADTAKVEAELIRENALAKRDAAEAAAALADREAAATAAMQEYANASQAVQDAVRAATAEAVRLGKSTGDIAQSASAAAFATENLERAARNAAATFDLTLAGALASMGRTLGDLGDYTALANDEFQRLITDANSGITALDYATGQADDKLRRAAEGALQLADSARNLDALSEKLTDGSYSANDLRQATDLARNSMGALNDSSLSRLQDAVAQVNDELARMTEQARATLQQLQIEQAQIAGDEGAALQLQYEQERAELLRKINEMQAYGNTEAVKLLKEALAILDANHAKKLAAIRAEDEAQRKADAERDQRDQANRDAWDAWQQQPGLTGGPAPANQTGSASVNPTLTGGPAPANVSVTIPDMSPALIALRDAATQLTAAASARQQVQIQLDSRTIAEALVEPLTRAGAVAL